MNKKQYLEFHQEAVAKMVAITKAKNSDYTGNSENPFANFMTSEVHAGVTTEQGFLVRMGDKMARIKSFVQKGTLQVKDESVQDTLLDLANYAILLAAYLQSKRAPTPPTKLPSYESIARAPIDVKTNGGVTTWEYVAPESELIPTMTPEVPPTTHGRGR